MTSHLRYLNKEEAGIEASANGAHEKKGEEMKCACFVCVCVYAYMRLLSDGLRVCLEKQT